MYVFSAVNHLATLLPSSAKLKQYICTPKPQMYFVRAAGTEYITKNIT